MRESHIEEIKIFLKKIGFSKLEIKIYIKLLEVGTCNVSELAKYTDVPRTNVHRYTDRLIKKGFITQTYRGKYKDLSPEDPKKLEKLINDEKSQLKRDLQRYHDLENQLPNVLNKMNTLIPKTKEKIRIGVKYYEGQKGAIYIYQEAFKSKELRSYVNLAQVHKAFPKNSELFLKKQKQNKSPKVKEIIDNSKESINIAQKFAQTTNFQFKIAQIPVSLNAIDILIFDGKVGMVNFAEPVVGSILKNQDYYINSIALFDFLWENTPFYYENTSSQ